MTRATVRSFHTPRESDLGLRRITSGVGLSVSVLPNGGVFAIEHQHERGRTLINQVQGSPLDGGIARLYLRIRAPEPAVAEAVGPGAEVSFGATADRFTWDGTTAGVRHSVSLWLHPQHQLWLWRVEVANTRARASGVRCDPRAGRRPGRPRLPHEQRGLRVAVHRPPCRPASALRAGGDEPAEPGASSGHPWVAHGCLEGAAGFATDAMQLLGPRIGTPAGSTPGSTCRASGSSTRSPVR